LIFAERLGYAFHDPGAVEFLHGVGEACTERGRSLLLIPAVAGGGQADTVRRAAVDGFVVSSLPDGDPHLAAVLSRPQPAVVVDSPRSIPGVDFVGIDDRAVFAEIAAHVFGLGHRRVGVVAVRRGEDVAAISEPAPVRQRLAVGRLHHPVRQQRLLGLLDAASAAGVPEPGLLVSERGRNARHEGALAAAALLSADSQLTAIMCTSDILALGVLDELAARRPEAGAQLTVTGFDDVPAAAAVGLTTIRQPMERKGRLAIEILLDERPRPSAVRTLLAASLVVRTSSGPVQG
jgi:DNA-binding LacI/PurR family transcriptional regulator